MLSENWNWRIYNLRSYNLRMILWLCLQWRLRFCWQIIVSYSSEGQSKGTYGSLRNLPRSMKEQFNLYCSMPQIKPQDLMPIRKFVNRMKGSKCKAVNSWIFGKAEDLRPYFPFQTLVTKDAKSGHFFSDCDFSVHFHNIYQNFIQILPKC